MRLSLKSFLGTLEKTPFKKLLERLERYVTKKAELLEHVDPDRIYVENVRSFLGVSEPIARFLCEQAARDGQFNKKVGVVCVTCDRIVVSIDADDTYPEDLTCEICEDLERESEDFRTINFYQLEQRATA